MNQVLLVTSDWPPRLGGVATYYYTLAQTCSEIFILTNILGASGDRVIKSSWSWSGWPHWLPLLWQIPYWKNKFKINILAAGEILPIGTALLLTRLSFGWPYLVFLHGLDIQLSQRNLWKRFLSRHILHWSAGVIVNSNFTATLALTAGADKNKIKVIYPSITTKTAVAEDIASIKNKYQLANKKLILSVARLVPRKGLSQVMQAIGELEQNLTNLVYVIVGDGPDKAALQSQAASLKSPVIFTGPVSEREKNAWYAICDLFVLTPVPDKNDVEGFGIVYLEAQAAGKPIIASNVAGVPEAVGEAGILIRTKSELVEALSKLLSDDKLRSSLASIGLNQVKKFSTGAQGEKFNHYIKNLNH